MKQNIVITTTNSVNNAEIERYIDLVSTNVVVGTNFFSDLGASFTDIFGGLSDTYQSKLQKIYAIAIDNLKLKAVRIGANAIVGLKIDFDEISGKGKSMFMISALGTAVYLKNTQHSDDKTISEAIAFISNDSLSNEITKRTIIANISRDILPNQDQWMYLLNNPIKDISENILNHFIHYKTVQNITETEKIKLLLLYTQNYFAVLENDFANQLLYSKLKEKSSTILELIKNNQLFSPYHIREFIVSGDLDIATQYILVDKEIYTKNDYNLMSEIVNLFDNLPDRGKIESVKSMIGKSKDKYICPKGHTNEVDNEFCTSYNCSQNIKGLNQNNLMAINAFKVKVDSLKLLFEGNI